MDTVILIALVTAVITAAAAVASSIQSRAALRQARAAEAELAAGRQRALDEKTKNDEIEAGEARRIAEEARMRALMQTHSACLAALNIVSDLTCAVENYVNCYENWSPLVPGTPPGTIPETGRYLRDAFSEVDRASAEWLKFKASSLKHLGMPEASDFTRHLENSLSCIESTLLHSRLLDLRASHRFSRRRRSAACAPARNYLARATLAWSEAAAAVPAVA
jgi:hypothetical protein